MKARTIKEQVYGGICKERSPPVATELENDTFVGSPLEHQLTTSQQIIPQLLQTSNLI